MTVLSLDESLSDSAVGAAFAAAGGRPPSPPWEPPSPEALQRDFPHYEIRGILGRGGMGAVYKGWQRSLERLVAIKILPPDLDDSVADFTERFKREAKAMAQLKHPGIVGVYDAGETASGQLFFIMECVEGTDLQRLMTERKQIDPREALRITCEVCNALAYAHTNGVIHRDIKPSNIMLDAKGTVKIADFGLAKYTSPGSTLLTVSSVTMGTPEFMAPEAMHGVANVDQRADIYGVGVMLYQMLTGKLPRGKYDPPSRIIPGLDKRLDRVVDRALQPEPGERYSTAAEMCSAIGPVTRNVARCAPSAGSVAPSRKFSAPLVLTSAVTLLLAAGAMVHFQPWKTGDANDGAPPGVSPDAVGLGPGAPSRKATTPGAASKDAPYVNSLGQEFVPVTGTRVLFCRWETRVKDYLEYAAANDAGDAWTTQEYDGVPLSREAEYPVVGVGWENAKAFCNWLTRKERAEGRLPDGVRYRLPTDEEWSRAVGLAQESGATPKEMSGANDLDYPWGRGFPPPPGNAAGNYADAAFHGKFTKESNKWIEGYRDGFEATAPVGSFAPNGFGIHDLTGNVWEWCEDWYDTEQKDRVLRGGAWDNYTRTALLSSYRNHNLPGARKYNNGFRCVLEMTAD